MNLSPHITLAEFTASSTAARRGIDNTLPDRLMANALATAAMLETIRAYLSKLAGKDAPIIVTSGYRCLPLNRAVGSSDTSDHTKAMAADWRAPAFGTPYEIAKALAPLVEKLGIGQLIHEFPGPNAWVHTSTRTPTKPVNRVITIRPTGTELGIKA